MFDFHLHSSLSFDSDCRTHITYDMLENFGVDSVKITKQEEGKYSITFAKIGSYDEFMGINSDAGDDVDEDDDSED